MHALISANYYYY